MFVVGAAATSTGVLVFVTDGPDFELGVPSVAVAAGRRLFGATSCAGFTTRSSSNCVTSTSPGLLVAPGRFAGTVRLGALLRGTALTIGGGVPVRRPIAGGPPVEAKRVDGGGKDEMLVRPGGAAVVVACGEISDSNCSMTPYTASTIGAAAATAAYCLYSCSACCRLFWPW